MVERGIVSIRLYVVWLVVTMLVLVRPPTADFFLFFLFCNIFAGLPFIKIPKDEKEEG